MKVFGCISMPIRMVEAEIAIRIDEVSHLRSRKSKVTLSHISESVERRIHAATFDFGAHSHLSCCGGSGVFHFGGCCFSTESLQHGQFVGASYRESRRGSGLSCESSNAVHRISFMVYTENGRYHLYNLPFGIYEVQVVEPGFESPIQKIELKPGANSTLDLALKSKSLTSDVQLVDYDEAYPPGPAREALQRSCTGCRQSGMAALWASYRRRMAAHGWHNV